MWIKKKARKEGYFTLRNSLSSKFLTTNKNAKLTVKGFYLNQITVAAVLTHVLTYVVFFLFFKQTMIAKSVKKQLERGIRDKHGKNVLKTNTATSL